MTKPHEQSLTVMQFDKERRCMVEGGHPADIVDPLYDAGREALQKAGVL